MRKISKSPRARAPQELGPAAFSNRVTPSGAKSSWCRVLLAALSFIATTPLAHNASAQPRLAVTECGDLGNQYGPYDYTNAADKRDRLPIVESNHFTDDVYSLRSGKSGSLINDIDYTLRAFPNHPYALEAMARLHRNRHTDKIPEGRYSLTCYFNRAIRFKPDDGTVRLIYGIHLFYLGKFPEAEEALVKATELMPESTEAQYNLGLVYVRLGKFDLARECADKAYAAGYPLPGLRDLLKQHTGK